MPTASIIITTHDRPQLLPRAIESARNAGTDVEVVIVDDASSDETACVCRTISDIRYVRVERNQGVAGARNIGLLTSTGDFITFLDDDDLRLPQSLDLQIAALDSAPGAGLIYGQALVANQSGDVTSAGNPKQCPQGDVFWALMGRNFIPCGTAVFRRSCLFRVGLLDAAVPGIDDWDLWLRLAALYPVLALEQPVLIWRRSTPASRQGTSDASALAAICTRQFHRKWLKLPRALNASSSVRRDARRRFSNYMARHLALETGRALLHHQFLQGQKNMLVALGLHPMGVIRLVTSSSSFRLLWSKTSENWSGENQAAYSRSRQLKRKQ
jgi:glycosyltransferase involved in cell wall biosynthesis